MREGQQRRPLNVARLGEHDHRLVAVSVDLESLVPHLSRTFLAVAIPQHHPQGGGEVVEARIATIGLHGDLQTSLFRGLCCDTAGGQQSGRDGE